MNDRVHRAITDLRDKWRTAPGHYPRLPRHQHDVSDMSEVEIAEVISWFNANEETQLRRVEIFEDEGTQKRYIFLWPKVTFDV